jgi:hypothetical protein
MTQNNLIELLTLVKTAKAETLAVLIDGNLGDEEKKNFIKSLGKIKGLIPRKNTGKIIKSKLQGM